jgi:hypothetical protein
MPDSHPELIERRLPRLSPDILRRPNRRTDLGIGGGHGPTQQHTAG